jgi:hypothetical protein
MDAHLPDDLSSLEKRLADLQPAPAGLDADRMLLAAGRALAGPGKYRLAWPAMAACFALLASVLAFGLARERTKRLALARQLKQRPPSTVPGTLPTPLLEPENDYSGPPPPASYWAGLVALERGDVNAWQTPADERPSSPAPPGRPILRAWGPGTLIDP